MGDSDEAVEREREGEGVDDGMEVRGEERESRGVGGNGRLPGNESFSASRMLDKSKRSYLPVTSLIVSQEVVLLRQPR